MKNNTITKFEFNLARYIVANEEGSELILEIDYKNKTFKVSVLSGAKEPLFMNEVERIAKGLIERKHGENFAWKFQKGKIDN